MNETGLRRQNLRKKF